MRISTIIISILLFAMATMIIYAWGLVKQKNQSKELMSLLFSKGQQKVKKYLKSNDSITIPEAAKLCKGMQARQPFSTNKAVVQQEDDFAKKLLDYMEKTGQIIKDGPKYRKK